MKSSPLLRLEHAVVTDWPRIAAIGLTVLAVSLLIAFTGVLTPAIGVSPLAGPTPTGETLHSVGVEQNVEATVVNDTTAYAEGATLENNDLYPLGNTTTPIVVGTAEGQRATITNLSLVLRYTVSTQSDADRSDPFYTQTKVLDSVHPDAETASVRTELPIRDIFATKRALQQEFGREPDVTATLHTRVTYAYSTPEETTRTESLSVGGAIEQTEKLYRLPHASQRDTHSTGQQATAANDPTTLANGVALLVGTLVVVGLFTTRATVSRSDPEEIEAALQRQRFEEWVTEVDSYTPHGNSHVVEVSSLGDLVDLAIDTQQRVLSPADMDEYLVVDDNTVFRCSPSSDTRSALRFGFSEIETPMPEFSGSQGPSEGGDGESPGTENGDSFEKHDIDELFGMENGADEDQADPVEMARQTDDGNGTSLGTEPEGDGEESFDTPLDEK